MEHACDVRLDAKATRKDFERCHRVAAEFREMPELRITAVQATGLISMEAGRCIEVREQLVGDRVLVDKRGVFQVLGTGRRDA